MACGFCCLGEAVARAEPLQNGQTLWLTKKIELMASDGKTFDAVSGTQLKVIEASQLRGNWKVTVLEDLQGRRFVTSTKNLAGSYNVDARRAAVEVPAQTLEAFNSHLGSAAQTCAPPPRAQASGVQPPVHPLVLGARRTLGVFFQDCEAASRVWDEASDQGRKGSSPVTHQCEGKLTLRCLAKSKYDDYGDWHYALRGLDKRTQPPFPQKPYCEDVTRSRPSIYGYGSKCSSPRSEGGLSFLNVRECRNSRHDGSGDGILDGAGGSIAAIDCSGFVGVSLAAAGLNLSPDASKAEVGIGTGRFSEFSTRRGGCLEEARLKIPGGIEAGDILNLAGHHVVLVDQVGPDPLGIERALARGNCDSISRDSFNFTIAHSGSYGDLGPARVSARFRMPGAKSGAMGSGIENNLVDLARKACLAAGKGGANATVAGGAGSFMTYRHRGDIAGCVMPENRRFRLKGEECLTQNGCNLNFGGPS